MTHSPGQSADVPSGHSTPEESVLERIERALTRLRRGQHRPYHRLGNTPQSSSSERSRDHRQRERERDRHQGFGAKLRVLAALSKADHLSISEIAEQVHVDQPRSSRLVQELEVSHLVRKTPDPADARRSRIILTEQGAALLTRVSDQRRALTLAGLADFSEQEQQLFAEFLERFTRSSTSSLGNSPQ